MLIIILFCQHFVLHTSISLLPDRRNRDCDDHQGGKVQAAEVLVLGEVNNTNAKMVKMIPSASSPDHKAPKSGEVSL